MTLRDIFTCKETSQKMAEVGFPQEGGIAYLHYCELENDWELKESFRVGKCVRAWSFSELWDLLPIQIIDNDNMEVYQINVHKSSVDSSFIIQYFNIKDRRESLIRFAGEQQPQEAAAELLLWVKNEGYLNE